MTSDYVVQRAEKSHCPKCGGVVWLLAPDFPRPADPMFYICFRCAHVAEAGKGPCANVDSTNSDAHS